MYQQTSNLPRVPGYPHLPSNSGPESEVRRRPSYFFLPGEDMTTNFKFITNFKFNCAAAHCYAHCARPSFWLAPAWAVADVEINADIRLTSSIKRFRFLSIVHYKQAIAAGGNIKRTPPRISASTFWHAIRHSPGRRIVEGRDPYIP